MKKLRFKSVIIIKSKPIRLLVFAINEYYDSFSSSSTGAVDLNLAQIYTSDNHSMLYKWAALSNYSHHYNEVLGFIKFSICVTAVGDTQVHYQILLNVS